MSLSEFPVVKISTGLVDMSSHVLRPFNRMAFQIVGITLIFRNAAIPD